MWNWSGARSKSDSGWKRSVRVRLALGAAQAGAAHRHEQGGASDHRGHAPAGQKKNGSQSGSLNAQYSEQAIAYLWLFPG